MTAESELTSALVYGARPVVELNRQRYDLVDELLLAMDLREAEGGLSSLELRFADTMTHEEAGVDFAFEFSETDLLGLGAELRVLAGDAADPGGVELEDECADRDATVLNGLLDEVGAHASLL